MSNIGCRLENCPVAQTGECFEGIAPLDECPNYLTDTSLEEVESSEAVTVEAVEPEEPAMESLPSGESLTGTFLAQATQRAACTLVVIVGPVDSGKTTLLVSLYESFHLGTFADFDFVGSQTLRAFEERCYLSRIDSGRSNADTARTPRAQALPFLHLAFQKNQSQHDLLLSDLSGEIFNDVVNSSETARELEELKRADHFLLMLDGARLIDPAQRHVHLRDMRTVLRVLIDEDMLRPPTTVHLVVGKWDQIVLIPEHGQLIERITNSLQTYLGAFEVVHHRVAARSERSNAVEKGYGLSDLLRSMAARRKVRKSKFGTDYPDTEREYLRYGRHQIRQKDDLL